VEIPDSTLGELLLDQPLSIVNLLDGSPTHALWSGVIYTQGLPTVRQTQRVGLYDVTAATSRTVGEVSNVDPNDARLFNRAGAIRLLLARDGYVVAEEVTDVPENERARFTALGTLDLTPGQAIGEDSALGGQGAMKELPAEVDALTSRDRAYHVVGSP
jgi:hypothetical protein